MGDFDHKIGLQGLARTRGQLGRGKGLDGFVIGDQLLPELPEQAGVDVEQTGRSGFLLLVLLGSGGSHFSQDSYDLLQGRAHFGHVRLVFVRAEIRLLQ